MHGVFKSVSWQIRRVWPLSWLQGWRKKKNGHGTKTKSIATGVGVTCCIEFGLDAQKRRRRSYWHTRMMCSVFGV